MSKSRKQTLKTGIGKSVEHDSARKQVTGDAIYVDDQIEYPNQLHVYIGTSTHAHANITKLDVSPCYDLAGVACVITHQSIPGNIDIGAILPGDPLLADGQVQYYGQPIFAVAASSIDIARAAAQAAIIEYQPLPHQLDVKQALKQKQFVNESHQQKRGSLPNAFKRAKHIIEGELEIGGQEHFYLETQVSCAIPTEDGGMQVFSSTQNPTEVQHKVAQVINLPNNKVVVEIRRMGGGFGGKETQAAIPACIAAVIANITQRPTKLRLPRMEDMMITGKRHPFYNQYKVGFNDDGVIEGVDIVVSGDCGYSPDLSSSIVDRAMFHSDNAYYLGAASVTGHRCMTNKASNTAFRGFGGPQGMMTIEHIMDEIAHYLKKDPLEVRKANYYGEKGRNVTHYHQKIEDNCLATITNKLVKDCKYQARRKSINQYNKQSPILKKGLAITLMPIS